MYQLLIFKAQKKTQKKNKNELLILTNTDKLNNKKVLITMIWHQTSIIQQSDN